MQQTKIVKVFLGSSITELKDERKDISAIGDDISNLFSQDDIAVRFIKCENLHSGNIGNDDQKAIDEKLRGCELSLFLFRAKAGEWTVHEFEVARALQKEKLHRLFVYFLRTPDETKKDESLEAFQQRLKKEKIFWKECDSLSEVMFSFAMGILTHLGITTSDGSPESKTIAQDGDARVAKYEKGKQHLTQLQEEIDKDISDLLAQIKGVLSDDSKLITARVIQATELYQKADLWASKTDYDREKNSNLLFEYASFLYDYGLYHDAETIYLRQIEFAEKLYGNKHKNTATSYNNIGAVYYAEGKYGKALEYYQKGLKALRTERSNTATSYNNIAVVYYAQGKYGKALDFYQKALKIRENLGTQHPDTAASYNNIGLVYNDLGNYVKALKFYQKALEIWKKVLGKEHPYTATSYNNIGMVYMKQGDYGMALEYYQKALGIREKVLGTEHPDTAQSYNNIGAVYKALDDYDKALEFYLKALEVREKALRTEHPDTATSYNNIGMVYHAQGDYGKALEYHQKALEIREKELGMVHPDIAQSYNNIGLVYVNLGDYGVALEHHQKALKIREKALGTEHPDTATSYNNIGMVYHAQGNHGMALEYYLKALEIDEKVLGIDHPGTAIDYNNIGMVYHAHGDYGKALAFLHKAYEVYEKVFGSDHPDTKNTLLIINIVKQFLQQPPSTPPAAP